MLRAILKNDILDGTCDVYVLNDDNKRFVSSSNDSLSYSFEEVLTHTDFVVFKVVEDEVELMISL